MELIAQLELAIKNMIATEITRALNEQLKGMIDNRVQHQLENSIAPFVDGRIEFFRENFAGDDFANNMKVYLENSPPPFTLEALNAQIDGYNQRTFGPAWDEHMEAYQAGKPQADTEIPDNIKDLIDSRIDEHLEAHLNANAHDGYTVDEIDLKFKLHEKALATAATKEWVEEQFDSAWSDRFEDDCDRMISTHEENEHDSDDLADLVEKKIERAIDGTSFFSNMVANVIRDELTLRVSVD